MKLNAAITQWQRITWQEYSQCPSTDKLIAEQFVTNADMLYRAVFTRNSAKLVALIAIKNNFPEEKSIFTITVHWNETYHSNNCDAIRVSFITYIIFLVLREIKLYLFEMFSKLLYTFR